LYLVSNQSGSEARRKAGGLCATELLYVRTYLPTLAYSRRLASGDRACRRARNRRAGAQPGRLASGDRACRRARDRRAGAQPGRWPVVTELVAEHVIAEPVPSLSCG
jgi:hypothetical protein